ncbi:glycoside hydrolase family 127 protein [Parabacteroides timonensis]|uniref:glycoside hydrolase family 127 protein n=1 Tax=Parabacteroides timonensis TaxID=1871013 RepID=UPI00094E4D84|nr:glycoside hydrolase family 127 protein [Parabacteroides timonensis]
MKKIFLFTICLLSSIQPLFSQEMVKPLQENKIDLFPLSAVRITDGQFKHIQDLDHEYLLTLEPDRLLSWFRREAGLTPKAQPYPFWESENVWGGGPLAGHILGFYMSSMSMMYQATNDKKILDRLNYIVEEMKQCQDAHGDGYLLATINGKHVFEDVIDGDFRTSNPFINETWEPVYIMNKIMLGLYNIYTLCGIQEAKPILIRMADWFGNEVLNKLNHENIQKLLVCEHGSINESYINVYTITGSKKYLEWAKQLNDEDMWIPLSEGKDILNGWHANTQIPKFTGFNAVYQYTDNKAYYDAANLFWNIVVQKHTWVNGGNSTGEHFFEEKMFEQKVPQYGGPESCNSVNMMRLTESLYQTDAKPERIDYYERILYNHILANFDPEEGMCCYYTSMRPGHYKIYGTKYHSFWCCTGTGFEAPAKFAKMIYAHKNNSLYVNLFMASQVEWKEKGIILKQCTRFPDENQSILTVQTSAPKTFDLKIRKPLWTGKGDFSLKINGKNIKSAISEEGYLCISREWSDGDEIIISFTPLLNIDPLKESKRYFSVTYGPIVLGTKINNTNIDKSEFRHSRKTVANTMIPMSDTPVLIGSTEEIKQNMRRITGNELMFRYSPKQGNEITFIPFNRIHFSRYAIYMLHIEKIEDYKQTITDGSTFHNRNTSLGIMSIDAVNIGDKDSEQMHKMETVNSMAEKYDATASWRRATNGGYFMYNLRALPNEKQSLYFAFRANDQDEFTFDVLVDGRIIKTFTRNKADMNLVTSYFSEFIPIPEELTKGKNNITIKIAARLKNITGDILDLKLLRTDQENI